MVEREMAEWYRGRISSSVLDDGVAVAVPSVTVEELRVEEDLEVTCEWIGAAGAGKGTGGPAEVLYDFVDFFDLRFREKERERGNLEGESIGKVVVVEADCAAGMGLVGRMAFSTA